MICTTNENSLNFDLKIKIKFFLNFFPLKFFNLHKMNRKIINDKSVNITTEVFFLALSVPSSFIVDDAL